MKRMLALLLTVALLLITAHRLPAPIQEIPERPTPAPEQSARPKPKSQSTKFSAKKEMELTASEISDVAAKLKELENEWAASWATHDSSVQKSLLADNFVSVTSSGKVLNKEASLDEFKSDTNIYEFAVIESVDVHVSSRIMAVVTGTSRYRGKTKSGTHFDNVYRFTDTWTERNGAWQCTATQAVLVSPR